MIKPNRYIRKTCLMGIFLLSGLLTACNDNPVIEATQEVTEEKKSSDYYGPETELLDVESELILELLGEEKKIPADMVIIEDKVKILLPSGFPLSSLKVEKELDSDAIFDYGIVYDYASSSSYFDFNEDPDGLSGYGTFFISLIQEEAIHDPASYLHIGNIGKEYEIAPLQEHYPSTATNYDYLTHSADETMKTYFFMDTIEEEKLMNSFQTLVPNDYVSKELEALICAIAASVEYLE